MFNPAAPYRYMLPNLYLSVADIANPDLLACGSWTWISLDIARFYEEHCPPSSGSTWPACLKIGNRVTIAGGGRGRHNLHMVCRTSVTAPPRVGCVVWRHILIFTTAFRHVHILLSCIIEIIIVFIHVRYSMSTNKLVYT